MAAADWLLATRPKTLAAGIVPVIAGSVLGAGGITFNWLMFGLCLAGALCIQIACNFINDAIDALKGADTEERIGPRRAVASGAISATAMLSVSIIILLLALAIGIYLSLIGGWGIFVLGVISILCAYAYTGGPLPLAYVGLGDVFVFLFFGLFAVLGSAWMQAAAHAQMHNTVAALAPSWWLVATAIGLQATSIIAVNNLRDRDTDAVAHKRTLAVRIGVRGSHIYITLLHLLAAAALAAAALISEAYPLFIPAGIAGLGGLLLSYGISRNSGAALNRFLGLSAGLELITGLSIAVCVAH